MFFPPVALLALLLSFTSSRGIDIDVLHYHILVIKGEVKRKEIGQRKKKQRRPTIEQREKKSRLFSPECLFPHFHSTHRKHIEKYTTSWNFCLIKSLLDFFSSLFLSLSIHRPFLYYRFSNNCTFPPPKHKLSTDATVFIIDFFISSAFLLLPIFFTFLILSFLLHRCCFSLLQRTTNNVKDLFSFCFRAREKCDIWRYATVKLRQGTWRSIFYFIHFFFPRNWIKFFSFQRSFFCFSFRLQCS